MHCIIFFWLIPSCQDDATAEKEELSSSVRELKQRLEDRQNERNDAFMKAEIDRLRSELYVDTL